MRVLHIVRQFHPAMGGLENFVQSLVKEQRHQGIDAQVLTLNRLFHCRQPHLADSETVDGIPVHRIGYVGSYKYPIAPSVLKHLAGYDLIHVHGVDFFADFLSFFRWAHRKPLVLSTHGGFFHTEFAASLKRLYFATISRLAVKGYKQIFACSNNDFELFRPLCSRHLTLIENGVDITKFADAGSPTPQPALLFIGRFSDNKRLDKLLLTLARLRLLLPQIKLTIIGKDWDGNEAILRQQIEHLALGESVQILTGLEDHQVRQQVGRHSYIISASDYEGFGMTLIEGMAAGLLPIASPIPSFQRIIERAQLGLLVNFDAADEAAQRIHTYLNQTADDYEPLRQRAMQAASRYAWPQVARQFINAYSPIVGAEQRIIQGVRMDSRSGEAIVAQLDQAIDDDQRLTMAYANAHTINLAHKDAGYRDILNQCLVVNDGLGVDLASKLKYGRGFAENLNGTDFTPRFFTRSRHRLKVFLLGASEDSVSRCFDLWQQRFPQHQWVGYHHGFLEQADHQRVCEQIRRSGANVVIVAMGNPLQERWLHQYLPQCGATIGIGVGALFDFTAGKVNRAPNWVRALRSEWIYRLVHEPKRMWKRYLLGNLTFLYNALGDQS
ncbi:WecB/TagA/CpsF family glycosyltransferase [Ferrimonas sp. SCSIO 43195]|uniref:WecB/TagA/CpsF family glycosyltransferase n=1 Tax=Ferrimonas sp. SCSIO 43195 TaxID=2822844 RepID=UPI0020764977|nr:WecB/TagA/CpsF family glycosyltransferase [Ferrimonas sp. SCSIO 43195]USD36068.1 WecB/TagA/CpsF family glycosyltransferase [Ferrimonas sp. SCSIO 43195]